MRAPLLPSHWCGKSPMVGRPATARRSMTTGGASLAAQAMGADTAYIGSPFIATEEARASDAYKQAMSREPPPISSTPTTSPAFTATT